MGCDIHLKLERCVHEIDPGTVRARIILLMIADRAEKGAVDDDEAAAVDRMPPELWRRCAQLVPVTTSLDRWVACPFGDWLVADRAQFRSQLQAYETRFAEAEAQEWQKVYAIQKEGMGVDELDEETLDEIHCEYEHDVRYNALLAAAPPSFSAPNYRSGIPGRGGWDEGFATLGDRHYNRHAGLARCRVPAEAL